MQAENIKTLSFGCRLNALESEKIQLMLGPVIDAAIVINTCAVTHEGERQSAQAVRRVARENPGVPIFVTGCAASRNPALFTDISNVIVIHNRDKRRLSAYTDAMASRGITGAGIDTIRLPGRDAILSKKYIQVQNGCNHDCAL